MSDKYSHYLLRIQFLGFRFSGWQKQINEKTIEGMLVKTLKFVLPGRKFKILGAGRTDAKVSALNGAFELFLEGAPVEDATAFLGLLNINLPADIKVVNIHTTNNNFNIIKDVESKEYAYLFSFGNKNHPFAAPFIANIHQDLNINLMKEAAGLFEGEHDFSSYTVKEGKGKNNIRKVISCFLTENNILRANFFPNASYALHIQANGFIRYQVRMIMGALIQLGKGEIQLSVIKNSLKPKNDIEFSYVAPGSGLLLNKLEFKHDSRLIE